MLYFKDFTKDCGICYAYRLDGTIPDQVCDDPRCGQPFHQACLYEVRELLMGQTHLAVTYRSQKISAAQLKFQLKQNPLRKHSIFLAICLSSNLQFISKLTGEEPASICGYTESN